MRNRSHSRCRWRRTLPPVVGLVLLSAMVQAQPRVPFRQRESNPNYRQGDWISYSVSRYVTSIAVGNRYVYFGTAQSGITRYDPFARRWDYPWTTSNGLADNEVWAVAYDNDTGFIWCASHTAISYYHATAERWTNFFKDEFGLPLNDEVESIGIAPGKVLFETRAGRLFEANKFGGVLLVADKNGIAFPRSNEIRWFGKRARRRNALPQFFVSGGYLFDPSGVVEDNQFRSAEVVTWVEDDWGNFWIGTWGLGAGRGDVRSLQLEMLDFGPGTAMIETLTFHDNVMWIGGIGGQEPNRASITAWDFDRERWQYFESRNVGALRSNVVHGITGDGRNLWFATDYGLSRYDRRDRVWKTYTSFHGLSDNRVFDVAVDDSMLYVATANGIDAIAKRRLSLARKDSVRFHELSPGGLTLVEVYDLELMDNLLWAATNRGVYVYDLKKRMGGFMDEPLGPVDRLINAISRYGHELWFASNSGIDVYDLEAKRWLGVPEGRFFPNTPVNRVIATKEAVWAATNEGVKKFDRRSKTWRNFTVEDGLLDNRVHAILLDGDYIWFGTARGLTQFLWHDPRRVD